jgi:succinate dehydrogenase/fumarate reductase flavoprotein subunit
MATNMDTHNKNDPGGTYYTLENGPYFGVPYPCLVAKGVNNLLVAGRAISADAMAGAAIRMIPCCLVFGQAAGTAAAHAIKDNKLPAEVDVKKLRETLKEQGAYLGD